MNTSDKLKALFDFQGFSKSEKLEGVINSTLASVENQLNEADLDMVSAAGYTGEIRLYGDENKGSDISAEAGIATIVGSEHIYTHPLRPGEALKEYNGLEHIYTHPLRPPKKMKSENIWGKGQGGAILIDPSKDKK